MNNYTNATVEGFLTHEPVTKKSKTGKPVCTFSLAVNHFSNPDSGPKVSYFEIETWEKVAEICSKNLTKGKRVIVFGGMRQDRWEGKDGKMQARTIIVGRDIRMFDSGKKGAADAEQIPEAIAV